MIYQNHPYEVVTTMSPSQYPYPCYGVKNVVTGIVEAYIGELAKAKYYADLFAKELKYGFKSESDGYAALIASLAKDPTAADSGPIGGAIN